MTYFTVYTQDLWQILLLFVQKHHDILADSKRANNKTSSTGKSIGYSGKIQFQGLNSTFSTHLSLFLPKINPIHRLIHDKFMLTLFIDVVIVITFAADLIINIKTTYTMKKMLLMLGVILFLGVACNQNSTKETETTDAKTEQQQQTQTPPQPKHQTTPVDPQEQARIDAELIQKFVATNNLKAQTTESGIYYVVDKPGSGKNPTLESTVKVHYSGTLLNGTKFDSSYDRGEPTEFPLRGVIRGWQEGIPLFKPGGKGKIIIPSGLAYGPQQVGPSIPPNSVLVFDIELLEVK